MDQEILNGKNKKKQRNIFSIIDQKLFPQVGVGSCASSDGKVWSDVQKEIS